MKTQSAWQSNLTNEANLRLKVDGVAGARRAQELHELACQAVASKQDVQVDCAGLQAIDTTAVQIFYALARALKEQDCGLQFVDVPPRLRTIFSGFDTLPDSSTITPSRPATARTPHKATALVVDDIPSMRELVASVLASMDYDVTQAEDGQIAAAAAAQCAFDLVVTDFNMPKVDGIALVRKLRSLPEYRCTPILVFSTDMHGARRREGFEAGVTGWISKNAGVLRLSQLVTRACSHLYHGERNAI